MLTCETFGKAIAYGIGHQDDAGAMIDVVFKQDELEMSFEVSSRIFDSRIEAFLVEEAFGSVLSVARHLVGMALIPIRVDFSFAQSGSKAPYAHFFHCPVHFGSASNRLVFDSRWLEYPLLGYDPITSEMLRKQLDSLLAAPTARHELVVSLARHFRAKIEDHPRQIELAHQANLSERTLRRRLDAQAVSYRHLRDEALYEKARDLMANSTLKILEVAQAVGYADARAFRRAFKRWSGQSPSTYRNKARAVPSVETGGKPPPAPE